jgi:hypothetical protein
MNRDKLLKLLVGKRERRERDLQDAVRQARQLEDQARSAARSAQQALDEAAAAEQQERDKLTSLTDAGQTFDIQQLMLREHVVQSKKEKVAQQQQEADRCQAEVRQRGQDVKARQADVTRNRTKIDHLNDDLRQWQLDREKAQDDEQDEETEDLSAVAWLAARANANAAEHGS